MLQQTIIHSLIQSLV